MNHRKHKNRFQYSTISLAVGPVFLLLAWGSIIGLMTSSFVAQLEATLRQTATEPHNLVVLIVKLLLWSVSIVSLVLAFRAATQQKTVH